MPMKKPMMNGTRQPQISIWFLLKTLANKVAMPVPSNVPVIKLITARLPNRLRRRSADSTV